MGPWEKESEIFLPSGKIFHDAMREISLIQIKQTFNSILSKQHPCGKCSAIWVLHTLDEKDRFLLQAIPSSCSEWERSSLDKLIIHQECVRLQLQGIYQETREGRPVCASETGVPGTGL
jgi:hypothetical protein